MPFFYWDPPRTAFTLPFLNHPVAWYGVLFAVGFTLAYLSTFFFLRRQLTFEGDLKAKVHARELTDRFAIYLVLGTVIGARLGEIFFYHWEEYLKDPWQILKVWEGGLSSHGAVIGIVIALVIARWRIKKRFPLLTFWRLLDCMAVGAGCAATFIRIGNFINQEIIGTVTQLPWGVYFARPLEGIAGVRHPVQLYEAAAYLLITGITWFFWRPNRLPGRTAGLFFLLVFSSRFLFEWFKEPQGGLEHYFSFLSTGQLLSLPWILFGLFLLIRRNDHLRYS